MTQDWSYEKLREHFTRAIELIGTEDPQAHAQALLTLADEADSEGFERGKRVRANELDELVRESGG